MSFDDGGLKLKLSSSKESLTLESSLQAYFYDQLQEINKKSSQPLGNELVYYSSLVMDHFGDANKYFEKVDGKTREKILGIKLMESSQFPREKQKVILKDIAETSLLLCGYFSDSLNKKIIDTKYYQEIGVIAYKRLNTFQPKAFDIQDFFERIAFQFQNVTTLMNLVSVKHESDPYSLLLVAPAKRVS